MTLDLQYLMVLQNLREATGGIFDEFFNGLSKVAVDIMPLLPCLVFWCLSRKWGYRYILTLWGGEVVNGIVKLSVCAYRPWIRSDQINPAGDSKTAATGYSFPSGHTMCATGMYGTTAVAEYRKRKWLAVLCIVLILLTGFSRNFLGVHTPQDVIVGMTETALVVLGIGLLMKWMGDSQKRIDIMSIVGIAVVIGTILFIKLKAYPLDYKEDGTLLVDPEKMMPDTFKGCGGLLGLIIGAFIERRWIRYRIPEGHALLPVLAAVGLGLVYSWNTFFTKPFCVQPLGDQWGKFAAGLAVSIFTVVIWPLVIRKFCGNGEEKKEEAA